MAEADSKQKDLDIFVSHVIENLYRAFVLFHFIIKKSFINLKTLVINCC